MAKKVLFINQEINPYVAESRMSVMGRELPQKMQEASFEIRTFMPKGASSMSDVVNYMRLFAFLA